MQDLFEFPFHKFKQCNTSFDSKDKFTAKACPPRWKLDNETNYTYFGARYYDSDISIWLSIDPLSDKYPSLSPYMYCAGNPVILVDPDGMRINRANSVGLRDYRRSLKSTKEGREIWKGMKRSSTLITVIYSNDAIVDQTSNGHFVLSGAYLHDANTTTRNRGRNSRGQTKTETYFRNGTVYVSMGTYQAQHEIMQSYGVSNWGDLTDDQKKTGLQQVLSSGNYTIRNIDDWSIVTPNNINIATGSNPDADYVITAPIDGETRQQYSERVSAHEGRHSVNANWLTSIYNKSRSEYRDRQERAAYRTESKVINEQLSR